jgi:hypothetical protein
MASPGLHYSIMTAATSITPSSPNARLTMPAFSLRSCVRAYLTRNTVQVPLTAPAQRLNRYPASPFCSITWFIAGEVELVEPPPGEPMASIRVLFGGPQSRPIISYNPYRSTQLRSTSEKSFTFSELA